MSRYPLYKDIRVLKKWKLPKRSLLIIQQLFNIFLYIFLSLEELELSKKNYSKQFVHDKGKGIN